MNGVTIQYHHACQCRFLFEKCFKCYLPKTKNHICYDSLKLKGLCIYCSLPGNYSGINFHSYNSSVLGDKSKTDFGTKLCGSTGENLGRYFAKDVARYFFENQSCRLGLIFPGLDDCHSQAQYGDWLGSTYQGTLPNILLLLHGLINK
jgi:hypothetical protein